MLYLQRLNKEAYACRSFLYSLLFLCWGICQSFPWGFIPGSVIGMILLFLALVAGWVKPLKVKKISTFLTQNMGIFFLPAGVGLMNALGIISEYWVVIVTACVVSTVLVIATVGIVQQKMGKEIKEDE